jgi:diadenosine tetraphosphate (Ap4A) HIT family hydrolase
LGRYSVARELFVSFVLDPRLAADTIKIGSLTLCDLLVMDDARYPWAILVPRIENAREMHDLSEAERTQVWAETNQVAVAIGSWARVEKVNIGALGNVVPQLHVHVVGRHAGDLAWPGPVWGHSPRVAYGEERGFVDYLKTA